LVNAIVGGKGKGDVAEMGTGEWLCPSPDAVCSEGGADKGA